METIIHISFIIFTIIIYYYMKKLYIKRHTPLLLPIITSTSLIVISLLTLDISYEEYMSGAKWISNFLGPAVVALALPLYKQWSKLKKYFLPLIAGILVGTLVGVVTGIEMSLLFGLDTFTLLSLAPKSVTSPVAMDIAKVINGSPTLASVFVMVAGIFGTVVGPSLLKWFKITHFLGRGVGFGTASHGLGTARALEMGEEEGAVGSIAMTLSAILTSILCPLLINLLL